MRATKALEQARRAALRGDVERALEALRAIAAGGDDAACPPLAELLAFTDRWGECIPHAGRLIANPAAARAGNVFDDMVRLLGRAGHETGDWAGIAALAESAERHVARTVDRAHLRFRYATILAGLRRYAARRGAPPHELVAIFGHPRAPTPADVAERRHREAVANEGELRPDLVGDDDGLAVHRFGLACTFQQGDEALRLFERHQGLMSFDGGAWVARHLVARGADEEAWAAIAGVLPRWWPCDAAQVAPTVLLTDPVLRSLTSPERCDRVLRTPRGPEHAA